MVSAVWDTLQACKWRAGFLSASESQGVGSPSPAMTGSRSAAISILSSGGL